MIVNVELARGSTKELTMNPQINALRHLFTACGLALLFTPTANAADPLAWKFAPGLTNRYRMTQDTYLTINSGATGDAKTRSLVTIDLSWTVQKVNDDGSAVLKQQIDRLQIKAETGDSQVAEIDSASKEDPQGQAATLVPLLKALTSGSFTVTMTPRGEVKDVEVPEAIIEALKNQPGAAQMGDLATPEGFKKLVGQASFVLPEKLEPGVTWTAKTEANMPGVGTQTATTTYRYEGPREVDGKVMEVFSATLDMKFAGGQVPVEITNQESKGEILFNRAEGRLESSAIKQLNEYKITVTGQPIKQKNEQNVEMKWVPEDEEKEE
jgi:hypothetical protein